jgi:tetrapyrrole methylase family protein / MazG family protein
LFILDALELLSLHILPFPPSTDVIILNVSSQIVQERIKHTLLSVLPENHIIKRIVSQGENSMNVEALSLDQLDHNCSPNPLTSLFIPARGKEYAFEYFQEIIAHLRAPDGCPWDREQTHSSLRPHLLEESYELLSAIDAQDKEGMQEEFGDLLLQIVLHAQIASETGDFNMSDIIHGIHKKIVRRHPHVFGDLKLADTKVVLLNWEKLKKRERAENGKSEASLLDGVALSLPSLIQADQYQKRAARVGFDWSDLKGVLDKLEEELQEVNTASDDENRGKEIGDLLFAVVNLARWYKVDPESALRATNEKFRQRFSYIEKAARLNGHSVEELSLTEMERLWQEAKHNMN